MHDIAVRCGTLAAWTSGWLADGASLSADEVVRAVTGADAPHRVRGLSDGDDQPLVAALIEWRSRARSVRLALPVPGDVRGLPPDPAVLTAALDAGAAVIGGGLALVPEVIDPRPSSAPPSVLWHCFEAPDALCEQPAVAEALAALTDAIRTSAAALDRAGVGGWRSDADVRAAAVRSCAEQIELPPHYPPRAALLVAQSLRIRALTTLAADEPDGGAVDLASASLRATELRHLATAARDGLRAGYNALAGPS